MKPWEWLTVPEVWLQWALIAAGAEDEVRPIVQARHQAEAERNARRTARQAW